MKRIAAVLFILCFCKCSTRNSESLVTENVDTLESINMVEKLYLPEGFVLDTFQIFDTSRNLEISIYIPISNIKEIDNIVKSSIEVHKNEFIKSLDEMIKEDKYLMTSALNSDFCVSPISIYKDEKIISYSFGIYYYHATAPHGMSLFHSFNFDAKTKKQIYFDDYFLVKSNVADTNFFTHIITKSINREGIFLHKLYDLDFNIEKDTISFNFSDYEIASYAEGFIQAKIHKKELYNKIRTNYR